MLSRNHIELLSPAKNADCAIAAILAGADGVYMGAASFGARAAAGNSFDDISRVCDFAHSYGARVNIALNTIFTDKELDAALETAHKACECGADALIIQDMGLLMRGLPAIPIHASTQCHINSADKAKFLENFGFDTLVLARELSLAEISEISASVKTRIECFVHGALCVSYSGQCYLSHAIGGRSANRGECGQPCRIKYELADANGARIAPPAHYLSLKDLNRSASVGELIDAGVSSFKIEGRLKSEDYVKNVTAHYRKALDAEIEKRGLKRSSFGTSSHRFSPNPCKSFNRGFCEYFLHGEKEKIASFESPKSRGEFIGTVKVSLPNGFIIENIPLSNGDGILIENPGGEIFGTNVQRADGSKVLCGRECPKILQGAKVWRNKDIKFESEISEIPTRTMAVSINISESGKEWTFRSVHIESGIETLESLSKIEAETAQNTERAKSLIVQNISKLGASKFSLESFSENMQTAPYLKASEINSIRRKLLESLESKIKEAHEIQRVSKPSVSRTPDNFDKHAIPCDYRANVLNQKAKEAYEACGINIAGKAPESGESATGKELMITRHCILRELDMCKKQGRFPQNFAEPLRLKSSDIELEIEFKCRECKMGIKKRL